MRSMTGYGRAAASTEQVDVAVDVKTFNGRYLDVKVRAPRELASLEGEIRRRAGQHLKRGRAEIYLEVSVRSDEQLDLNEGLARSYGRVAERLTGLGFSGEIALSDALQLPGLLSPRKLDFEAGDLSERVLNVVEEALRQTVSVRAAEGEAIRRELRRRLQRLKSTTEKIRSRCVGFGPHYRGKLEQRIRELSAQPPVDEARLAQEILFYAERADVSEELTRLGAHIERFSELIESSPPDGVGKNLDFLCQELNREMNTIVSKTPLPESAQLGVAGKLEIEKLREQVQNVE